jgi:hypothetical protein
VAHSSTQVRASLRLETSTCGKRRLRKVGQNSFRQRAAPAFILAGITIAIFGMTTVFVPSDLRFIGLDVGALTRISPTLIPVISHDRAGFGGGLCSIGCLLLFMARCAVLNRSFVQIVAVMGCAGFGGAIGVHFIVGYLDLFHLLPAIIGFFIFLCADGLLWIGWRKHLAATMGQLDSGSITP